MNHFSNHCFYKTLHFVLSSIMQEEFSFNSGFFVFLSIVQSLFDLKYNWLVLNCTENRWIKTLFLNVSLDYRLLPFVKSRLQKQYNNEMMCAQQYLVFLNAFISIISIACNKEYPKNIPTNPPMAENIESKSKSRTLMICWYCNVE